MPKEDHLNTLDLPPDADFQQLKGRYNQLNEILDPDLIDNETLAQIVKDAQKQVEHAYAYLEKILPGQPASEEAVAEPPVETEVHQGEPSATEQTETAPPATEAKQPPVTTDKSTLTAFLHQRWKNLTCTDPAPFTPDWWDINKTTVNALLCILIALMAFYPQLRAMFGGPSYSLGESFNSTIAQVQSFFASIRWSEPAPPVNDDRYDIKIPGLNSDNTNPDPRPINLRQARKFLFNYYSVLRQNHPDIAFGAWTNEYQQTHSQSDFTAGNNSTSKFLPSDYTLVPDDAVVLSVSTPDTATIQYQTKWFTGPPGLNELVLVYTNNGWRIDSVTKVAQRSPTYKPSDTVKAYLTAVFNGQLTNAYQYLDATYQKEHSYEDWSKGKYPVSYTLDSLNSASFTDTYSPADSSPDSATVQQSSLFSSYKTFPDTYTLINNNGTWRISAITSPPVYIPPYVPPYLQPPDTVPGNRFPKFPYFEDKPQTTPGGGLFDRPRSPLLTPGTGTGTTTSEPLVRPSPLTNPPQSKLGGGIFSKPPGYLFPPRTSTGTTTDTKLVRPSPLTNPLQTDTGTGTTTSPFGPPGPPPERTK